MGHIEDFIALAEKDNRVGVQNVQVVENKPKVWEDGRTNANLELTVLAAPGSRVFCNVPSGPLPTEAELNAIKAGGNQKKIKGVGFGLRLRSHLAKHYGVDDPAKLDVGTILTADLKKEAKTGYIKVQAFLPKRTAGGVAPADDNPF